MLSWDKCILVVTVGDPLQFLLIKIIQVEEDDQPASAANAQNDHPWPYLQEMFSFVGSNKDSWRMNCVLCRPQVKELRAYKNSPSNLKKHIVVSNSKAEVISNLSMTT